MILEAAAIQQLITDFKVVPGGRYLYASGRSLHQTQNCLLLRCDDTRESWADTTWKAMMALMTGAGIGIDYGAVRPSGLPISRTGGEASGPIPLMHAINEIGRRVMQGGQRRSAIWAGLPWNHPDVEEFIRTKDWDQATIDAKATDFNHHAPLDMTNVSVQLDDSFFEAYARGDETAHRVYRLAVSHMVRTAEPGFSVDVGSNAGETLRNACTEITSRDDSDVCNLGHNNLGRIRTIDEMAEATKLGSLFLLAGTVYSDLPYDKVNEVREQNRRLGLGLMGVHEWLLQRGKPYAPDPELANWLDVYTKSTQYANEYADRFGLSRPVATRSIAPTGTTGIVAQTTTGMEPIHAVAYIRRYKEASPDGNDVTKFQYVIDPTAKRLIDAGADPATIQDAYSIDVEDRIKMQVWLQQYVDHGVSSTINLPAPITDPREVEAFGDMLIKYLPKLRGITCYPDGCRGGQPITPVSYEEAISQVGVEFTEQEDRCKGGVCAV